MSFTLSLCSFLLRFGSAGGVALPENEVPEVVQTKSLFFPNTLAGELERAWGELGSRCPKLSLALGLEELSVHGKVISGEGSGLSFGPGNVQECHSKR